MRISVPPCMVVTRASNNAANCSISPLHTLESLANHSTSHTECGSNLLSQCGAVAPPGAVHVEWLPLARSALPSFFVSKGSFPATSYWLACYLRGRRYHRQYVEYDRPYSQ